MKIPPSYESTNRELWNKKTEVHYTSDFYDVAGFKQGKSSLKHIELELLGDIRGKKILHLQCHFGQDTLSLARMGAEVTGVDLSDKAIEKAKTLAAELSLPARFICCNIFRLDQLLNEQFDLIFTSYGVLGWLPELKTWGKLIHRFLRPAGTLVLVEFHPVVWMFDDLFEKVKYGYFNTQAFIEESTGTYTDRSAPITNQSYEWCHSLADVTSALLGPGMEITHFSEYDFSPYDCFNKTIAVEKGYQIQGLEGKIPMVFALKARKPA